jgi:two-component system chemotaxis response regulator CheV
MTNLMQTVDERTRLAGANKLEVLLFSLGTDRLTNRTETFGINVFKVREVMKVPEITHAPDMRPGVEGMVSLRGTMVPIIKLSKCCKYEAAEEPQILIVTEYNRHVHGFLVHSVEHILRMEWNQLKAPPPMMAYEMGGLITAVTELEDGRIVMVLDVEKVLAETAGVTDEMFHYNEIQSVDTKATVLFADDSAVARKQIQKTLDKMGVNHMSANNGVEAWQKLQELADRAASMQVPVNKLLQVVLTDIEMPEMDGYVLTKKIKSDSRLKSLPVVMHSSLSSGTNIEMGTRIGADSYVAKFDPVEFAKVIGTFIHEKSP